MSTPFIVTGGAGFIGSNLVAALNKMGSDNILIVDRLDADGLKARNLADLAFRDLIDKTDFRERIVEGNRIPAATVFHLGACSSTLETNAAYLEDNNVRYSQDVCRWALAHNIRFVYASSAATYGDGSLGYRDDETLTRNLKPLNLYGESKRTFDLWALDEGLFDRITGIKYFNVYGPREDHKGDMRSLVNKAYTRIRDTGGIELFRSHRSDTEDGMQERDFVYVRDAVAVTSYFHEHPELSGLFNCGTGTARTWLDLAHALFAAMGKAPRIRFVDMPESIRDKYQYHTEADMAKLRQAGYADPFTSIEDGVRDYVANWLANDSRA